MDDKKTQQSSTRFCSLSTFIQHHPYISLIIPSLIFISISATHLLVNDKTLQTIFQVIVYISGIIIGAILLLIEDNQRKADSSKINLIFLYGIYPATLLGFVYFSKIIGDASAIFGISVQIALAIYAKTGKSKESDIQENLSNPSPKFIQENSSTSIQNDSPISIQNNNNSPISIQNNINTTQNVTNTIDERSERERITINAYKMLDSKDFTSRISAVKTLANMADSWLEDSPNCKKDEKKCQDIIDILCARICSPFPLVAKAEEFEGTTVPANYNEKKFIKHQTKFREEQQVRRTIFATLSNHSSTVSGDKKDKITITPGAWSKFNFNFNQAPIFYPLDNLCLENSNFTESTIYKGGKFTNTKFIGKTIFNEVRFKDSIDFTHAHFIDDAIFQGANFEGNTNFSNARFEKVANFALTEFNKPTIFHWVYFIGPAYFDQAHFKDIAKFTYTQFIKSADFNHMQFYEYANFEGSNFTEAYFVQADFIEVANFRRARFHEKLELHGSNFAKHAFFYSAYFNGSINFRASFHQLPPIFFAGEEVAHFSCKYKFCNFNVDMFSQHTINLGKAELDGIKRQIPVGAVLFDPDSGRISEPAKLLENSDTKEEKPAE